MIVLAGRAHLAARGQGLRAPTIAIGNFDGVHRGHQALIARARSLAAGEGGETTVMTFDPHPAKFFAPHLAPPLIAPLSRRLELLAEIGADVVIVEPFTAAFAGLSAEAFVAEVLHRDLGARHLVVGPDFSFGHGRRGDAALLSSLGQQLGIGVLVHAPVMVDGLICSSTKIREFLLEGRVEGAQLLLGRRFEIVGTVVRGQGRGRTLGVPTANLSPEGELLPQNGIYAAIARRLDGPPLSRPAAVSVGTNPTFADAGPARMVEAHLLDFEGDLYGTRVRLELHARLRDERRFESSDRLIAQMQQDIAYTRALICGH
jgi:riboflavin kinase/FMN adenylyltransferase